MSYPSCYINNISYQNISDGYEFRVMLVSSEPVTASFRPIAAPRTVSEFTSTLCNHHRNVRTRLGYDVEPNPQYGYTILDSSQYYPKVSEENINHKAIREGDALWSG
jgi:hypothetical protein